MSTDPERSIGSELLSRAREEYRSGSLRSAWAAVVAASAHAREVGDPVLLADAALVITSEPLGEWDLAARRHALCAEALLRAADLDHDRVERLRALQEVTRSAWTRDDAPVAAIAVDRPESRSAVLHARHRAAIGAGRPQDSLAIADDLAALASATARREDAAWAALWRLDAYCRLGDRLRLDSEMMALASIAAELDSPAWRWRLAAARTTVALLDGYVDDVAGRAAEALRLGLEAGIDDARLVDLIVRSAVAVQTGTALAAVETEIRHALAGAPLFAQGWRAVVLLELGRTDDALTVWRALAPRLPELPRDSLEWLVATAGFAALCTAADDTASARYLVEMLTPAAEQHVTAGILTPYEGPVALALGSLAVTLGDREAARAHYAAALRLSEEMHAPHFAARARSALDALAGRVGPLTARENDIALLVADGLTNRQIATRLYISERTVENHVGHILRKLDASGRAGIAARIAGR